MQGDVSRSATTLEVKDLVEMAWQGRIRVPHFQRSFRWKLADAEKLFDSIVRNYPIGSLLLWARPAPAAELHLGALRLDAPELPEALWVVDGQQRITSIANVLNPEAGNDPRFALAYDLSADKFVRPGENADPTVLPLPVLYDPQRLMKWFWDHPEIKDHFDQASAITDKIRTYAVPAYLVKHSDERVLQDIFDRMNNYGKRLTKAEVFSALNAGEESAAGEKLDFALIASHVDEDRQFGELDEGTVLQAVLARRDPDIQREVRVEFTDGGEDRDTAYRAAENALLRAVSFLQIEAQVPHLALLPYRYLLIVLARFFAHHPEPEAQNVKLLRRWFWRAAAVGPGIFPGGTTGATRIYGQKIVPGQESSSVQALLNAIGAEPADSPVPDVRKFRANSAAGKIVLCSWWALEPRDPTTGEPFSSAELAESLTGQWTASDAIHKIVTTDQLDADRRNSAANRMFLPVLRQDVAEASASLSVELTAVSEELQDRVCRSRRSHLVSPEAAGLLRSGRLPEFIDVRQQLVYDTVWSFLRQRCEWGFEDTPPLAELVIEDEDEDDGAY